LSNGLPAKTFRNRRRSSSRPLATKSFAVRALCCSARQAQPSHRARRRDRQIIFVIPSGITLTC
jgi:hypothetical protein